jgi:hypothetical protein
MKPRKDVREFFVHGNETSPRSGGLRLRSAMKFTLSAFLFFVLAAPASAKDEIHFFRTTTVAEGVHEGSITCFFCDVVVRGDVAGDVVTIWGSVIVSGKVREDIVAVGGTVRLKNGSEAGSDVVAIGGAITSEGAVVAPGKDGFASIPWVHMPGQPSIGWRGAVALLGFHLVCALLPTLILRPRAVQSVAKASQRWFLTSVVGFLFIVIYSYGLNELDERLHTSDMVEGIFAYLFLAILGIGIAGTACNIGNRLFPNLLLPSLLAGAAILTALELIPYLGLLVMILAVTWATGSALWSGLGFRGPRPPRIPNRSTELRLVH